MNPYFNTGPNLENASKFPILVTPDDNADLPQVCKALRIYNPGAAGATVHLLSSGGSEVTITVPAGLTVETIVTQKVFLTGTTPALIIHGYSD